VLAGRRIALPAALGDYNKQIAEARQQKRSAVDAHDFAAAGAIRKTESGCWPRSTTS
jgi:hypothetical protein